MGFAIDPAELQADGTRVIDLRDDSAVQGAAWAALRSDPTIGVAVVREDGFTVWCNERAAVIFLGDDAKPRDAMGKPWREIFPEPWIKERLGILRQIKQTGQGVLLRTLWRGRQQGSWIRMIDPEPQDHDSEGFMSREKPDTDEPRASDGSSLSRFLIITRRMDAREFAEVEAKRDVEVIDSDVVHLGDLDKLTARELEVLALLGQGLTVAEIGEVLHRSPKTVDRHRDKLAKKLGGTNRVELARVAFEAGLELSDASRRRTSSGPTLS
ncbi:MAG: hypothetical protein EA378_07020 [Phycisphaerales bacterium]|nr:MAG: hypothetical protein EA378_07020 [Phycisphaerales bacterium]